MLTGEHLRALFDEAGIGIIVSDPGGRIVEVNEATRGILGHAGDNPACIDLREHSNDDEVGPGDHCLTRLAEETRDGYQVEKRLYRKDGELLWVRVTTSTARDEKGNLQFYLGMVEDVTNRRRLEEEALQAQRLGVLVRLVGGIVHDFSNQLTAIMGSAELGARTLPVGTPTRRYFQDILKTCRTAASLSKRLLSFSRPDEPREGAVDLGDVLLDMLNMLRRLIREDIDLVVAPSQGRAMVEMDPSEIEQIVSNLVVNARDALPGGGVIAVNASVVAVGASQQPPPNGLAPGSYVVVSVRDSGTGMSEEVKLRLFEPFFTTKKRGEGTGLGLAVCHEIVKQAGGHIEVHSERGVGTTVQVYIPCAEAPETSLAATHASK